METFGIASRPDYPPIPVGVAIKEHGQPAVYHGFGHVDPLGPANVDSWWNNATAIHAHAALKRAYANPDGVLFHNAKFDLDVIETHFGLAPPHWSRVHDSMFLLFLDDPNQREIGLKQAAHRLLRQPPEERDELVEWLLEWQPVEGVRIGRAPGGKEPPGKYIAHAPAGIVGPYAIGDVDRTAALFRFLWPRVMPRMAEAYDRERRLLPILLGMERRGIAVDTPALERDIAAYTSVLNELEAWTRDLLEAPDLNIDSGEQLVRALNALGAIDMSRVSLTPKTGKPRADKATLADAVTDHLLRDVLRYMGILRTCLSTFMKPWLLTAQRSGGLIYTTWNQTRGAGGGARTGRFSSSPNFQNIPVEFDELFKDQKPPIDLPPPPLCRRYIIARPGHVLAGRDYAGQELRILAHFTGDALLRAYREDPAVDLHAYTATMISDKVGKTVERKTAKTMNFAIVYGSGAPGLARQLGCDLEEAQNLLAAYLNAFPGVGGLRAALKSIARKDEAMTTIGGRDYRVEPPTEEKTFEYKMVNTLIQGSAADQTKEAMVRFHEAVPDKLLLTVHDELVFETTPEALEHDMELLRVAMDDAIPLDTPMLTEGESGLNWGSMEAVKERTDA